MQYEDFEWFKNVLPELYQKFGDKYVAIKDKNVIGVHETFADCIRQTMKTEKLGSFIVQKLGSDDNVYTEYVYSILE